MLRIQGTGNETYEIAELLHGRCILLATPDGRTQVAWNEALKLVNDNATNLHKEKLLELLKQEGNKVF